MAGEKPIEKREENMKEIIIKSANVNTGSKWISTAFYGKAPPAYDNANNKSLSLFLFY